MSEKHNHLINEFVQKVGRETKTSAELMVVVESMIAGTMMILERVHGMRKADAAQMAEAAINRALERFAAS